MKKSVLLLFAVGLLGLSACGKNDGKAMAIDKTGNSVLTAQFINANIESLNQNEEVNSIPHPQSFHSKTFYSDYSIISKGNGILVIRNSSGYYGFYSTFLGKYIIEPCLNSSGSMRNIEMIGSMVTVYDNNTGSYIAFDAFGNFFNDLTSSQLSDIGSTISRIVYDNEGDKRVVVDFYTNYGYKTASYVYSYTGFKINYNGEYDDNENPNSGNQTSTKSEPQQGDLYKSGWLSLDQYGLSGYSLVQADNGYCTVFEGDYARSSFYLPNIANSLVGVFNKKILTQQMYEMPEDTKDYSFSRNGVKYYLESTFIDIGNGKKEKLNFDALFIESRPLLNTKKQVEFYQVTYQDITDQKVLGNQFTKIVDGSFAVRDDVSGASVFDYVKITYEGSDYYFNNGNKVLYDAYLRPMTFLKGLSNVTLAKQMGVVVARSNSTLKWGVIAPNGRILVPFEYDSIYTNYAENSTMIMSKNGVGYRYRYGSIVEIASEMTMVAPNLFQGINYGVTEYFTTNESLFTLNQSYYSNLTVNSISNLLGYYSVTLVSGTYSYQYNSNGQDYINVLSSEQMNLRSYSMSYSYQEKRNNQSSGGTSPSTAIRIYEGSEQTLYSSSNNYNVYFYIYCSTPGYYYIYSSNPVYQDTSYYNNYPDYFNLYDYPSSEVYNYRYRAYLNSGYNYGFYMSMSSYNSVGYVQYQYAQ